MARIAYVLEEFRGGGAEKSVLTVAEGMVDHGHEIHLFIWGSTFDYVPSARLHLHLIPCYRMFRPYPLLDHLVLAFGLRRAIFKVQRQFGMIDLIVSTVWPANRIVFLAGLRNAFIRIANTPSCELKTLEKIEGRLSSIVRAKLYRKMFASQPLIAISSGVEDDLVTRFGVSRDQVTVIHNPVDGAKVKTLSREENPDVPHCDYIIHVARFAHQKRHDLLFSAFKRVDSNIKLVLLTKVTPALTALIASHGLQDRVICPGFQSNPYPWMRGAKLSVLCSDHEGFANVVLESLICGTPVVSTNCPSGPAEILAGELAHWLVPVNDPVALSDKINEALGTDVAIPPTLAEKFSLHRAVESYLSLATRVPA